MLGGLAAAPLARTGTVLAGRPSVSGPAEEAPVELDRAALAKITLPVDGVWVLVRMWVGW